MFAFSATHWLNMVSLILDVSRFWASLVVVALVGMSEKGKMFGFHCFFLPISGLVTSFVIVAAAHLGFWGVPGISNTPRIISPLESPQNGIQPGSLLEVFPTLRTSPYFFPVPFMMKETFSKTYSERYKIHSVPFYRGFVKTITAARPQTVRGTIWDNTHQVPALCATQVKSWAGTTPEE